MAGDPDDGPRYRFMAYAPNRFVQPREIAGALIFSNPSSLLDRDERCLFDASLPLERLQALVKVAVI